VFCKDLRGSTTSAVGVAKIMHDVFFLEMESLLDGVWIYVVQCCGCRRRSKKQEEKMVPLAAAHDRERLLKVEKEIWCIECRINFYILDKS